jgi:hypothetical protein
MYQGSYVYQCMLTRYVKPQLKYSPFSRTARPNAENNELPRAHNIACAENQSLHVITKLPESTAPCQMYGISRASRTFPGPLLRSATRHFCGTLRDYVICFFLNLEPCHS